MFPGQNCIGAAADARAAACEHLLEARHGPLALGAAARIVGMRFEGGGDAGWVVLYAPLNGILLGIALPLCDDGSRRR